MHPDRSWRLWQAEPLASGTAMAADRWFPIAPGTETAFAAGLIAALDGDAETLARCASITGIAANELSAAAKEMQRERTVVIADAHPVVGAPARETLRAVACLNGRLKAYGRVGGIVARRDAPTPKSWGELAPDRGIASVEEHSIGLLFIDDAVPGAVLPWKLIASKLAPNAVVIAASWNRRGVAERATYALPAISYLEGTQDLPASPEERAARFALSLPLVTARANAIEPVDWFGQLAGDATPLSERLKERATAIYAAKRGELVAVDGERKKLSDVKDADEFWKALGAGARWTDDANELALRLKTLPEPGFALDRRETGLAVIPAAWLGADVSPLMSKLWVESDLKPRTQQIYVHPETAREFHLDDGRMALLQSSCGECTAAVCIAENLPRGVVAMAAGEAWYALAEFADGGWSATARKVVRA
jgi:anaerobic selenocysteine-containing dehydrogenase